MNTYKRFAERIKGEVDAIVAFSPINRRWLTDFKSTAGYVVVTPERCFLGVDFRYIEAAKKAGEAAGIDVFMYEKQLESLAKLLDELNVSTVGYEEEFMTVAQFKNFKAALGKYRYVGVSSLFTQERAVKEPFEIERMAKAQEITDKAFMHALSIIRTGMTERQLRNEIDSFFINNGADGNAFESIVLSGENTSRPHGVPGDREFRTGDLILMDTGSMFDGYCSDMTRTVALGYIKDEAVEAYNAVLAAQEVALNAIKAGEKAAMMDKAARDVLASYGWAKEFGHSLGHGVGLEIHESPYQSTVSKDILKAGQVVTVEPGVYFEGKFGIRIEDMVLVTETGLRNFTGSKKQLIVV